MDKRREGPGLFQPEILYEYVSNLDKVSSATHVEIGIEVSILTYGQPVIAFAM